MLLALIAFNIAYFTINNAVDWEYPNVFFWCVHEQFQKTLRWLKDHTFQGVEIVRDQKQKC